MGEYSILDILRIILKRIWLISVIGILCGSIAFMYCRMLAVPTYSANASIIGSNGNIAADLDMDFTEGTSDTSIKSNDLAASLSLTDTYVYVLTKMPSECQEFVDRITEADLVKIFNASSVDIVAREDTLIIDISVISTDPEAAKQIANIYSECAPDFIAEYNIGMVKPLATARKAIQVSPRTVVSTILAAVLGGAITCIIIVYIAVSDKTINGEDDIKNNYDIPLLGSVPDFQSTVRGGKQHG